MGLEIITNNAYNIAIWGIVGYLIWKFWIKPRVEHDKEIEEKGVKEDGN